MSKIKKKQGVPVGMWNIQDFDEWQSYQPYQDGYSREGARLAWYYQQGKISKLQEELKTLKQQQENNNETN